MSAERADWSKGEFHKPSGPLALPPAPQQPVDSSRGRQQLAGAWVGSGGDAAAGTATAAVGQGADVANTRSHLGRCTRPLSSGAQIHKSNVGWSKVVEYQRELAKSNNFVHLKDEWLWVADSGGVRRAALPTSTWCCLCGGAAIIYAPTTMPSPCFPRLPHPSPRSVLLAGRNAVLTSRYIPLGLSAVGISLALRGVVNMVSWLACRVRCGGCREAAAVLPPFYTSLPSSPIFSLPQLFGWHKKE